MKITSSNDIRFYLISQKTSTFLNTWILIHKVCFKWSICLRSETVGKDNSWLSWNQYQALWWQKLEDILSTNGLKSPSVTEWNPFDSQYYYKRYQFTWLHHAVLTSAVMYGFLHSDTVHELRMLVTYSTTEIILNWGPRDRGNCRFFVTIIVIFSSCS